MLRPAIAILCVVVHVSLLAALPAAEPAASAWPLPSEGEAAILAALDQPTGLDFAEQPLSDVIDFLSHKHKVGIQLDNRALTDAGVGTDTPITMKLDGIRLRSALRLMLRELDLTYLTRDGYLLITSQTEAENMLKIKAYAVRDLVTADSPFLPPPISGPSAGENYQSLIDLITSTVAPTTWNEGSDPGIRDFRNSHTISFLQTEEVHEEAAELLAALRLVRDRQLAAVKALPGIARAPEPRDEVLQSYAYRLVPWPRYMNWLYHGGMMTGLGGGGMGGAAMGGGAMGGGMYALADETTGADEKLAAAATSASAPSAAKPADTPKSDADDPNKPIVMLQFDVEQCENWTKELASDLPDLVEPENWQPKGKGSIRMLAGALVIRQTPEMHERIIKFLSNLLPMRVVTSAPSFAPAARLPAPGSRLDWPHEGEPRAAGNDAQVEAALAKKCDVEFRETPFAAAMQALVANTPIKLWIDQRALADAGIGTDTPVTRSVHGVPIRAAFKLILGELDLTYVIRNEVLVITSTTEAESMLTTKVYPVFDLVADTSDGTARHSTLPFRPIQPVWGITHQTAFAGYQSLINNITANIPPSTWDEAGGPGAIREFANSGALVISQTTELHEEIAEYLRALRQAAAAQR